VGCSMSGRVGRFSGFAGSAEVVWGDHDWSVTVYKIQPSGNRFEPSPAH
jgi:hypothetical protein